MTDNEMKILILLLQDAEDWEKQRLKECEDELQTLPASAMKDKIYTWSRKHKECIEAAKCLREVFDHYILNKIHNILK